ncbi:MAG: AbrB/MazE/SpoVT family DNA-binding domain-containing protein [Clostridia bacterium]|nr:AbrB/MazE/SpoVT family DNA-binding domain-containing protein [Clostridia bacterium]
MKDTGIVRNIDEMGRLVLPKEMRKKMDIASGDEMEIYTEGDRIIIKKYVPTCSFCGAEAGVTEFRGKRICSACIAEIKAAF